MAGASEYPRGFRADGLPAVLSGPARLAALEAGGQFGSAPEAVFDDLTRLASAVTGCGISAITFVGETRTYWKSVPHLPEYTGPEDWQNAVGDSFCYFPIGADGPFVVEDAENDPRTAGHKAIGPWGVGAWAGFPIVTGDGHALGSMCVIDPQPRVWKPEDLSTLAILARAVSNEVNLRLQEMLTNALKHGRRGEPVVVEQDWQGELRMRVHNAVEAGTLWPPPEPGTPGGMGIDGMRRRLDAVGGRLAVRCEEEGGPAGGPVSTATAWMPVRAG